MKYFFFDIDGTLAVGQPGKQYIPESTKLAIQKLKEKGYFVAIATGRSYAMAVDYMHQLGFVNMVSDGGNGITINNELLEIEPLDYQACIDLMNECKEKGYPWSFSPTNEWYRIAPDQRFYDFTHDLYLTTKVIENVDLRDYPQVYKMYVACYYPDEYKLESLNKLPWCRYHKEYFFVEPTEKSKGIKKVVDYFHGDYKDVVVFGDGENDLSMFLDEWTSIAMGNAVESLKAKATYITDSCDQDGIYNACKHFKWID